MKQATNILTLRLAQAVCTEGARFRESVGHPSVPQGVPSLHISCVWSDQAFAEAVFFQCIVQQKVTAVLY